MSLEVSEVGERNTFGLAKAERFRILTSVPDDRHGRAEHELLQRRARSRPSTWTRTATTSSRSTRSGPGRRSSAARSTRTWRPRRGPSSPDRDRRRLPTRRRGPGDRRAGGRDRGQGALAPTRRDQRGRGARSRRRRVWTSSWTAAARSSTRGCSAVCARSASTPGGGLRTIGLNTGLVTSRLAMRLPE